MERDRGLSFKLWMPPRVKNGQASGEKTQETAENYSDFNNMQPLGYSKCHEKQQNLPFSNTSVVPPTKPVRADFAKTKVVAPMEKENDYTSAQAYFKLSSDVEKMRCWKVKVDCELVQKDRRLQDSSRTIESQRKAIQDLQFENERLSTKLLEQFSENEDLRDRNNTTSNLCGMLKETFQRSAEKMHLFESEREETHQLSVENSENIKKLIAAFDTLAIKAEENQQQMQKVKEDLMLYEDLKEKYQQEYKMKEEEIAILQIKIQDKEDKVQKTLDDLHESEKQCQQLHKSTREASEQAAKKDELIKTLKDELDIKSKSIDSIEAKLVASEEKILELSAELKSLQSIEAKLDASEDKILELSSELNLLKSVEAKLDASENKILELSAELSKKTEEIHKLQVSEEKAGELQKVFASLEKENLGLREESDSAKAQMQATFLETENFQKKLEKNFENLQEEILAKGKGIKAVETKLCNLKNKFEVKFKAQEEYKKENEMLKRQIGQETAKSHEINTLYQDSLNRQRQKDEDLRKLQKDLEAKSTFSTELEKEVQELKSSATEAIKEKEEAELKCQHKIADVLAVMEKHQGQCDQMLKEKDAEFDVNKKLLESDLTKLKTRHDELEKQLMTEKAEKENLQKELKDLKKELSLKISELSQTRSKQSAPNNKQQRSAETPGKSSSKSQLFDFSSTWKTPSNGKDDRISAVIKKAGTPGEPMRTPHGTLKAKRLHSEDTKTPGSVTSRVDGTSKIKAYRVKTPPAQITTLWGKSSTYLEPKTDSSDDTDLLGFDRIHTASFSTPQRKVNLSKKSPIAIESPRKSLKVAAIKRMRAAGWTAVTGSDQKKRRAIEKIFA